MRKTFTKQLLLFGVLIILIVQPTLSVAQTKQVSGQVTSESGESLPGVNILIKGTSSGTITDSEGKYKIELPAGNDVLIFSFIGYDQQEIALNGRSVIDVSLKENVQNLDQVVVIGYGTQKKSDLTGAVTRVDAEAFENQPITQVSEMLAGTVAGFYGNQGTSAAGGGSLEVRGPTSLTGGTTPLVVLDGVIFHGNLADINPNDIASIDVLKDASSAAVYGSKAASGVIIITTKQGEEGKPKINFTTKVGVNSLTNDDFRPRDGKGYENFRRDFFRTLGIANRPDWYWNDPADLPDGVTVDQWRNANPNPHPDNTSEYLGRLNFFETEVEQYKAGKTVDWFDEVIQPGVRQDYDLSIGGGSKDYNYYWSVGYTDNEGIRRGDEFQTIRTRLNLDFNVTDWLTVGTNAQFAIKDDSSVPASLNIGSNSPYSKIREDDGSLKWYPHDYQIVANPLLNHFEQKRLNKTTSVFASMFAAVDLPFGFNYRVSFQPRIEQQRNYNFWGSNTITGGRNRVDGYGTRQDNALSAWMVDNILSWDKEIGVHNFAVTLLYNAEQTKTFLSRSTNETFSPNQVLGYNGMQFGSKPSVYSNDTEAGGNALMARVNYTLMDKYLFTASVRRDGYSAFGQENNKATFPAAAFAWRVSDEKFFSSDLVNNLKLRLSWGINGNRDIGIYSALAQIGSVSYYDGSNVQMGLYNNTLANPNLRWEKTEAFNIGIDLSLLENRIDLSAEFYDMTTTDLLMNRQLPRITGFSDITSNLGELKNHGMDLTLNTVNVSSANVTWKSSFIFSMNRNKIVKLFGDYEEIEVDGKMVKREVPDYSNHWFPGQAIDAVWEYNVEGVWQLNERSLAAEYGMMPGDYKATDVDNNKAYDALVDKDFIGHTRPRHRLGLRNDVTFFKNFTASVFVRADLGHIGNFPYAIHESSTYDRINYWNIPYWTPTNGNNEYARTSEVHGAYGGGLRIFKPRSFVRIQDVSLSYNLSDNVAQKFGISNMRVFASVRNPFTFTKWPGWDPESGNRPMPKTYTVGFSLDL